MSSPLDPNALLADAVDTHSDALVSIFEKLDKGEEVDFFKEGVDCSLRLAKTTGKFLWYWGNIAKLWLMDTDTPRFYGPPPVTGAGFALTDTFDSYGFTAPVVASGLRRRGETQPVDPAEIKVTVKTSGSSFEVTVEDVSTGQPAGLARGLYEGKLTVTDSLGTNRPFFYNIYVDPS